MCRKCEEKKRKCNCHDPLIGAWACNFTAVTPAEAAGDVYVGNVAYSAGGTCVCDLDISNQRPFFGFPNGAHATPITGSWKRTGKHTYQIVGVLAGLNLNTTTNQWEPLARIKEVSEIEVHGDRYTGTRTLSFYEYYDNTLTNALPIPPLTQTIDAKRVVA